MSDKPVKYEGYWPTPFLRIPSGNGSPMWGVDALEQWWVPDGESWDSDEGKWVIVQPQISQAMQDKLK